MSLSGWLRTGWLVLAADVVYWLWTMGHTGEPGPEGWWGTLNIFLYYGGALLFVVLLIVSLLVWHANEHQRTSANGQGSFRNTGPGERDGPGRRSVTLPQVPDFLRQVRRRRRFEPDTLKDWWLTQLAIGLLGLAVSLATREWGLAGLCAFIALYAALIIRRKARRARGGKWS